jgi:hypothetical protein
MIHPEFLELSGAALPIEPLPMLGQANMFILNSELRSFHRRYLRPGVRGYFVEGPRRVGVCEAVELIGIYKNPIV